MEVTFPENLIDRWTAPLPEIERRAFAQRVERLRGMEQRDGELSTLLADFAVESAGLFAATAVAIWFVVPAESELQRRVEVGWENFPLDSSAQQTHDRLISVAAQQRESVVVLPFANLGTVGGTVSASDQSSVPRAGINPTDSYLLMAPVTVRSGHGESGSGEAETAHSEADNSVTQNSDIAISAAQNAGTVALLEIVLGPKPLRHPDGATQEAYCRWLDWLAGGLARLLARQADDALSLAGQALAEAEQWMDEWQRKMIDGLERSLQRLHGFRFDSLAENQAIARRIHQLLDGKGLRVRCPECGTAAILRCQRSGNSRNGLFVFDHYLETGRTFHGGSSQLPKLQLIAKPPRRSHRLPKL